MCEYQFGKNGLPKENAMNDFKLFMIKCDKYYKVYNNTEDYNQINNLKISHKIRKIEVKHTKRNKDNNFTIFSFPSNKIDEQLLYVYISFGIRYASILQIDDNDGWSRRYLEYRLSGRTHSNIRKHFYHYYIKIKSLKEVKKLIEKTRDKENKIHYRTLYKLRYEYVKKKYGFKKLEKYLDLLKKDYKTIIESIINSIQFKIFKQLLKKKGKNIYELDINNKKIK
tara:strand:- start:123 stop:797 length:675 start_codon:yes stop_codon:yes gene_type:complete